ncbi:MAG TPA: hypothetical protein VGJ93_13205 [Desulfuromonadaceae bacterium]|jgi:hypothetical protein
MTEDEFNAWVFEHRIPPHAVDIIRQVRDNEPFRRVAVTAKHVENRQDLCTIGDSGQV